MVLRGLQKEVIRPLIGYIHYETPEEEQNFATLLEMLIRWMSGKMMKSARTRWISFLSG